MSRKDIVGELPEEIAEYVPDNLPSELNPDCEAEADGMYLGIALVEWAVYERGFHPKEAFELVQRSFTHGRAAAQLDQLGLPDKLFRN